MAEEEASADVEEEGDEEREGQGENEGQGEWKEADYNWAENTEANTLNPGDVWAHHWEPEWDI